MSRLEGTFEKI